MPPSSPAILRVLAKVEHVEGCWVFKGRRNTKGYGTISVGLASSRRKLAMAHRVSYEHFVGPIPDGLTIDHLCFNKACVNPDHLEAVTRGENTRRAWVAGVCGRGRGAAATHCAKGHPWDEANTNWYNGKRRCRQCRADAQRRRNRAKAAARSEA